MTEGTQDRLLDVLQRLMAIEALELSGALTAASDMVNAAFSADKTDAFFLDPKTQTLVALGTSETPMGNLQRSLGLHVLPVANGGRTVECFLTGEPYFTAHADQDPGVLKGIKEALGVRTMVAAPIEVAGERRGVLVLCSATPAFWDEGVVDFVRTVAGWVGMVAHRTELVERVTAGAAEQARQVAAEELVTVLAHDVRNLLTPVRGRVQMLLRTARRDGREADVANALAAIEHADRVQHLASELLDVARLDEGTFAIARQDVDLVALARQVAALGTEENEVRIETPGGEPEVRVRADPDRVRQALENLVGNALRVSPPGSPIIVRVERKSAATQVPPTAGRVTGANQVATVSVIDAGPGISPEVLPRLFRRFGRGPGSSGLGLGLYIVRRVAEAHGGSVTADSTPGLGARFVLTVPLTAPVE